MHFFKKLNQTHPYMITWQDKLMVIGSSSFGVPHMAYMLDLKNYTWTEVELPEDYSGHVQSSSYLEIWKS